MTPTKFDMKVISQTIREKTGNDPINLRFENNEIHFSTLEGEQRTKDACYVLMERGLQHVADDGKPEFFLSGAEGADRVNVRWPIDPEKPIWNEDDE